jgi:hypothetical protein
MKNLLLIAVIVLFILQGISDTFSENNKSNIVTSGFQVDEKVAELSNKAVKLLLGHTPEGAPLLLSCQKVASGEVLFRDIEPEADLGKWIPVSLMSEPVKIRDWQRNDDQNFLRAESVCELSGGITFTWITELDRESSLIRLSVKLSNHGTQPVKADWFPVWSAAWSVTGTGCTLQYWEALSFAPHKIALQNDSLTTLSSRLHSSDAIENGKNPYWLIATDKARLYFALDWCGGWKAELKGVPGGIGYRLFLPENETQLTLAPGESITGPALMVTPVFSNDEAEGCAEWMKTRESLAARIYGGPKPTFPFGWNHWYTVRFNVDEKYLTRQVEATTPYNFDYFIVDAGWYKACGDWTPHPDKFSPGTFSKLMKKVQANGTKTGIWTCPQFVDPDIPIPSDLVIEDKPGFHRSFINGKLIDYVRSDFGKYLVQHIGELWKDYNIGWWKYDQDFFTAETRNGEMKNVVALQEALTTVRKAYPGLYIESCQSGGRMLNEFTVLSSQTQWIRDGGRTGIGHARSNFAEALQSMEILPPWAVNRWINRPNENDQDNDEFTRMYCRSAMAGIWGLVADLPFIGDRQRAVIIREVERYRRLNHLKKDCLYDIVSPEEGNPAAGVVFYNTEKTSAGLLFLRWDEKEAFKLPVAMNRIQPDKNYRVEFVDSGEIHIIPGDKLKKNGLTLQFSNTALSMLVFVEAIE